MQFSPTNIINAVVGRLRYQVYLLQLENYQLGRYLALWRAMLRGPDGPLRKTLDWTPKMMLLVALASLLAVADVLAVQQLMFMQSFWLNALVTALMLAAVTYFFFVYLVVAALLVIPLDRVLRRRIVAEAKRKVAERKKPLTVIGITGSFGKTSMKLALVAVLDEKFRVLAAPENINTPVGIARLLLEKLTDEIQVLIVEMGAYQKGDIAELCALTPPDVAVLTGINEAHLERFGSLANTVATKFEIVDKAKPEAFVVVNGDDVNVEQNAAAHLSGRAVEYYGSSERARYRVEDVRLDTERPGISFTLNGPQGRIGEFALPHLAPYAAGLAQAAAIVAQRLGMTTEEIARGIANIKPAPHRLQLSSRDGNIFTIDDSYNGNPAGVAEAIATLKQFEGRRRIYVTPGLVEMGERTTEVHETIGRQLADAADLVVLVKNSVTPSIAKGLKDGGFAEENIRWFDSGVQVFAAIPNMLKAGDVVLFQNDWPENYQ